MLNIEEIKPTLLITVITDTVSLVTMLVRLFPLFVDSSSAFCLGRLLWKQVGSSCFPFTVRSSHRHRFRLKGIIWLLIVVVAGVPPTVSSSSFPV